MAVDGVDASKLVSPDQAELVVGRGVCGGAGALVSVGGAKADDTAE